MKSVNMRTTSCITTLVWAVIGIAPTLVFGGEFTASEIAAACNAAMSGPIQFRCVRGKLEMIVSKQSLSNGPATRIEFKSRRGTRVSLLTENLCVEHHVEDHVAFAKDFQRSAIEESFREISETELPSEGVELVSTTDASWELAVFESSKVVRLKVDRTTKHMLEKTIERSRIDGSDVKTTQYLYRDFVSPFPIEDRYFDLPPDTKVYEAKDTKELASLVMSKLKAFELPASLNEKMPTPRRSEKTGFLIPPVPPGKTKEEFAKGVAKAMRNLPLKDGLTEERRNELADFWETNTDGELLPASSLRRMQSDQVKDAKQPRRLPYASLGLGLAFLFGVAVVMSAILVRKFR
jgi:hypothetical protein